MSWYVNPTVNEGYPSNTGFPASYPADWSGNYPASAWRVSPGVNEGYPYTWWMIAIDTGKYYDPNIPIGGDFPPDTPEGQGMDTGGAKSNYPNGFTNSNRGGVANQLNSDTMAGSGTGAFMIRNAVYNAMAFRMWALDGTDLQRIVNNMNSDDAFSTADLAVISALYGGNIYDGFVVCKVYPFPFDSSVVAPESSDVRMYGRYLVSPYKCYQAIKHYAELDLGTVQLDISQAWEIENVDYSIYIPYAGVHPIDVRSGDTISVSGTVDLINGLCEYQVRQNGQITAIYKANIGVDIPMNLDQGITQSNMVSNIASTITNGLPVVLGAAGGPAGAAIGGIAAHEINKNFVSHKAIEAPQVGGSASMLCYPYARIIAKIPKMFRDGYGYKEMLGENRSTTYTQLSTCSGYVRTKNYKTPLISATEEEKRMIENLMDSGVIL